MNIEKHVEKMFIFTHVLHRTSLS